MDKGFSRLRLLLVGCHPVVNTLGLGGNEDGPIGEKRGRKWRTLRERGEKIYPLLPLILLEGGEEEEGETRREGLGLREESVS